MTILLSRAGARTAPARPSTQLAGRAHAAALAPLSVGLFAFLVSVTGSWIPSLWYDEAATVTSATRSWGQLFAEVQRVDAVHAAYYSLMHVVFDLVGYTPFSLRLPSAIAIGACAGLIVVLVRLMVGPRMALISGVIFALIPRVAWAGGEGRSYAMSALLAVTITLLLVTALHRDRARWWVLYAATAFAASTFYLYLVLIVVAHGVAVFALRHRALSPAARLGLRHHPVRHWLLATAGAGVAFVPFLILVVTQGGQLRWIPPIGHDTIHAVALTQWFWKSPGFGVVAWLLIAAGVTLMIRGRRRTIVAAVVLPALLLPTAILIVVSVVYLPVYSPKYATMCTPFVAIAMAVPLSHLRARWLRVAAVVLIATLAVPNLIAERAPEAKQGSSWSKVAGLIGAERAAQPAGTRTAIIYGPLRYHLAATTRAIEYAYPQPFAGTVDVTLSTPASQRDALWETHHRLVDELPVVRTANVAYLITSVKQDRRPATDAALATIGWHETTTWHFRDVNVVEYRFTGFVASAAPAGPIGPPGR